MRHPQKRSRRPGPHNTPRAAALREAARWPLDECLLNDDWRERGIAWVVFVRRGPGRQRAVVGLVVDLFCFGVRRVHVAAPTDLAGQHDLVEALAGRWPLRRADPHLAAKVVGAGAAWAEALGLPAHPDYPWARALFDGIDTARCATPIPCGRDGKPVVFAGPGDETLRLVAHLERRLGPGGYHLVAPLDVVPEG